MKSKYPKEYSNIKKNGHQRLKAQAYHPLFVCSTVLFNGRYGYEF